MNGEVRFDKRKSREKIEKIKKGEQTEKREKRKKGGTRPRTTVRNSDVQVCIA